MRAFYDLTSERPSGFGMGQIPWSKMYLYARDYCEFEPDLVEAFINILREMDRAYVEHFAAEQKQRTNKPASN